MFEIDVKEKIPF